MRTRSTLIVFGVSVLVFTLLLSSVCYATGPLYDVSKEAKVSRKLLRGLLNIPFSVIEIPLEINKQVKSLDPFTGFWVGAVKGSAKMWKRACAGVWELFTFPIEIPKGYRPIIEPEFPMMDVVD